MRTVHVAWQPDAERFTASGVHPEHTIAINAPHPSDDHAATGFSATELLLAGAGACAAWDVVEILRKQRQDVSAIDVRVDGEQDSEAPHSYRRIALHFRFTGRGLSEDSLRRIVRLSIDRYCSVIETVRGVAEIVDSVEVVDAANGAA